MLSTFPHPRHEMIALRHADDAIVTEFSLLGTHLGPLGPVPATGATFRVRMTAFFVFRGEDELVCERIYFDQLPDGDEETVAAPGVRREG